MGRTDPRAGYALPAVLTVVTVLTLIFITAIAALKSLQDETRAAIDAVEFERLAISAEAHAAFLASTEPLGQNRLRVGGRRIDPAEEMGGAPTTDLGQENPLYLDDTPYLWSLDPGASAALHRRFYVSLQDTAGLLNLDFSRRDALLRLFESFGANELDAETLADELLDYIDVDSARRLRGAEADDYARGGRPPPPNAPLRRVQDVFGLLDWTRIVDRAKWRRMAPFLVADPNTTAFNVNTAPAEVLETVMNLSPQRAREVIAGRRLKPINSLAEMGIPSFDELNTYTFPNGRMRFSFADPASGATYSSILVLTPENQDRPVWIENISRVRHVFTTGSPPQNASAFPDPPA